MMTGGACPLSGCAEVMRRVASEPVGTWHPDVHQHDVRVQLVRQPDPVLAVVSFANNAQVVLRLDSSCEDRCVPGCRRRR